MNKLLKIQLQTPAIKDWGSSVLKDVKDLNINHSIDEIEEKDSKQT